VPLPIETLVRGLQQPNADARIAGALNELERQHEDASVGLIDPEAMRQVLALTPIGQSLLVQQKMAALVGDKTGAAGAKGFESALANNLSALTSPEGLAAGGMASAEPRLLGTALTGAFTTLAARQVPDQVAAFRNETNPEKRAELGASILGNLAMIFGSAYALHQALRGERGSLAGKTEQTQGPKRLDEETNNYYVNESHERAERGEGQTGQGAQESRVGVASADIGGTEGWVAAVDQERVRCWMISFGPAGSIQEIEC
jgi:hypothetical protein